MCYCSLIIVIVEVFYFVFEVEVWIDINMYVVEGMFWKVVFMLGVFSYKELDVGMEFLLEKFFMLFSGDVFDFVCGVGVIVSYIMFKYLYLKLYLIDVSVFVIYCSVLILVEN